MHVVAYLSCIYGAKTRKAQPATAMASRRAASAGKANRKQKAKQRRDAGKCCDR